MDEAILRRICRDAGMPDLLEVLADRIPPTDLQTVLLETARRRASARSPAELIGHYGRDRTTRPGAVTRASWRGWLSLRSRRRRRIPRWTSLRSSLWA
jgi:hypothetical protein